MPGGRPNIKKVQRRNRRSLVRKVRDYSLDGQNPGRRRNWTVRESQTYAETTLFQMSGVFRLANESGPNRVAGLGTAGE